MKKFLYGTIAVAALAASLPAVAAPLDDEAARLEAIERENAILRKENAALRERALLQSENAKLRDKVRAKGLQEPSSIAAAAAERRSGALPPAVAAAIADPRLASAYAADAGLPLKAPPAPVRGEFSFFVEGGAFWTGGDPARTIRFATAASNVGVGPQGGPFDLNPRLGWDAAVGFDYRFAGSAWHVSAQFRYGEASKSDSDSSSFGPTLVPTILVGFPANTTATAQTTASNKETHWLADFAIGHGPRIAGTVRF
jgi:hypothetical protein